MFDGAIQKAVGEKFEHEQRLAILRQISTARGVRDEWAKKMADLVEGPHAGWAIYADWLDSFLRAALLPPEPPLHPEDQK